MLAVKSVSDKGEIVIPKKIRDENGLTTNSEVGIISTKRGILIIPIKTRWEDFHGIFADGKSVDYKKLDIMAMEVMYGQ